MGGPGSGNWLRWGSKRTTECQYKIDIRWMKKHGYLQPGTAGIMSWTRDEEAIGSIRYYTETDRLVLNYCYRNKEEEYKEITDQIFFTWTSCNFGGSRQWFRCPSCYRRVAVIYGFNHFRCRHCHNLTYASQQENRQARLMRKARKMRKRLGGSNDIFEPILFKPKYMHQRTFDQLRREADRARDLVLNISARKVRLLLKNKTHS